jgi:hypothetical protein
MTHQPADTISIAGGCEDASARRANAAINQRLLIGIYEYVLAKTRDRDRIIRRRH